MSDGDVESGVPAGHTPVGNRNSAATIDHTEVHVDLTKTGKGKAEIKTGEPGVVYNSGEPGQTAIVVQTKPDPGVKPKDFVVTSCLVIMFCNFIFGLLGYHWGTKSNYAWQLGDEVEARKHAKTARLFVIIGVIVGVLTWVLALTLFFTISPLRPNA